MPSRRTPIAAVPPEALAGVLQLLAHVAEPEMMAAAIPLVRARLRLTPEKLAVLLVRLLNPDEFIKKGEEVTLRGVHEETLKNYKEEKLLPEFIGALAITPSPQTR